MALITIFAYVIYCNNHYELVSLAHSLYTGIKHYTSDCAGLTIDNSTCLGSSNTKIYSAEKFQIGHFAVLHI